MTHPTWHTSRQNGFTLVELMITVAVLAILLFIGTSLTRAWVDRSHVDDAIAVVKNSVFQTRAAALRNTNNQPTSIASSAVCFDQNTQIMQVVRVAKNATDVCDTSLSNTATQNFILQRSTLANNVNLKLNNETFKCLAFNANGVLVAASHLGNACNTGMNLTIEISKNSETANVRIN